jgi:L-ascorbate metabolism protein UlaG (beta-lactamase superfamily)
MRIKYLAHSSFLLESEDGIRIITDPYNPGYGGIRYKKIEDTADIVTVSHEHGDHNYIKGVPGNPIIVKGTGKRSVKGIEFNGIPVFHDKSGGRERGENTVFCFELDGIKIVHLGDLGHLLSPSQIANIGGVDILFIPVGGFYTIDEREATEIVESLSPEIVIPMHYKTPGVDFPISGVDKFLSGKDNIEEVNLPEYTIKRDELPEKMRIVVLAPACI